MMSTLGISLSKGFRPGQMGVSLFSLSWLVLLANGCATYSDHLRDTREALAEGQDAKAMASLSAFLEEEVEENGRTAESHYPLLLVERGTLHLIQGNFGEASRDFVEADPMLEVLDIRNRTGDEIGKFLFSGSVGPYAMPAFEKGMLNTLNMLSFLAQGELSKARVEARRYSINRTFFSDEEAGGAENNLAALLAAQIFALSGREDIASRYLGEVNRADGEVEIAGPLSDLSEERMDPGDQKAFANRSSEVMVVIASGRAPHKAPVRLPLGLALTIAASHGPPSDSANLMAAQGLVTWVNFSELQGSPFTFHSPSLKVDNKQIDLVPLLNVEERIRQEFEAAKPMMMGAAVTRTITRAVAGGVVAAGARDSGGWGALLGLLLQGGMAAADTPDTRSWTTLPHTFWVGWVPSKKGGANVKVEATDGLGGRFVVVEEEFAIENTSGRLLPLFLY